MRILLIEDEKKVAEFVARGLRAERFAVDISENGQNGWEMASSFNYDLIVLDLMLPGGSYSFTYASMDTPAQEFGNSATYPPGTPPVGTSVAYQGGFLVSPSDTFVVTPAPEPSSIVLLAAGSLGLLIAIRRGKLSRSAQA